MFYYIWIQCIQRLTRSSKDITRRKLFKDKRVEFMMSSDNNLTHIQFRVKGVCARGMHCGED